MSRIYWDTMLFIYLLEDHPTFSARAQQLLDRAHRGAIRFYELPCSG